MESKNILSILDKIVDKIGTLSYKTDRILSRFTKSYDVLSSSAVPSGFTKIIAAATVIGGYIYQRIRTGKSSNWNTGNITNTQTASMVINKTNYNTDYPEETMAGSDWGYNIQGITGNVSGLKSYYTSNSGTTRTYNIAAVETADASVLIGQISSTCFEQV